MVNAENLINDANSEIGAQLASAQQEIDALGASWGGDAASGFMGAFSRFIEDGQGIQAQLARLGQYVGQAVNVYKGTDSATTDVAGGFGKSLSGGLPGF
jgi:WXG100 family type VII secretion target